MDLSQVYKFNYGIFRYFNVAGSDPKSRSGSIQKPASHLIAKACETALKVNNSIDIYGNDYNTKDGTCIRDYIHVSDIASAHLNGINFLNKKNSNFISNLGYGKGYSVKEVLDSVKRISKNNFTINITSRRKGDIDSIVADNKFALNDLCWLPKYNNIDLIVKHQLEWCYKEIE
jgi:UDP-glucose 4-epimerase